jgi:anaerobic selenocysteine-containing dehydrogenase
MSKVVERRLKLRKKDEVKEETARINPKTAEFLGITDKLEVVLAGKKRYDFDVVVSDAVPANEVWLNSEQMKRLGIADNTTATVRRPLTQAK